MLTRDQDGYRLFVLSVAAAVGLFMPAMSRAQAPPLTAVATPVWPPGPVGTSHLDPYDDKYDYAINNCHTYANNG